MEITKERHMVVQSIVNVIKSAKNDGKLGRLSMALLVISENFANDKYVLNLLLRKTDEVNDKGVKEQRECIKHLLSNL